LVGEVAPGGGASCQAQGSCRPPGRRTQPPVTLSELHGLTDRRKSEQFCTGTELDAIRHRPLTCMNAEASTLDGAWGRVETARTYGPAQIRAILHQGGPIESARSGVTGHRIRQFWCLRSSSPLDSVGFAVESSKSGVTGPDPDTETAGHRVEAGSGDTGKSGLDAEPHRIWRTRWPETPNQADSINQDTESSGLDDPGRRRSRTRPC
jgi:hypothetical protein